VVLWFVALALIVIVVAWGTVASSRRWPEATHGWPALIAVRVAGIVLVTACVVLAAKTFGSLAAAATGVLGVAVFVLLLVRTSYGRLPDPRR
jgi:hypothetical protein